MHPTIQILLKRIAVCERKEEIDYKEIYDRCFSETTHGRHLSEFKRKIETKVGYEKIQLVTISRPSAYGEYEPYHFVDSEAEFEKAVVSM